jgi:transcriptional regulator with XRE-family HTH domain
MGRQLKELDPQRSSSHRLGAELRRWRLSRGLSQDQLGVETCHSGALVSKIERGDRAASLKFCEIADAVLSTGGTLARLWAASVENDAARPANADGGIAQLRRALGTIGVGDDRAPSRSLDELARDVGRANQDRLHARYADVARAVPGLIGELSNAELRAGDGGERRRVAALMVLALRAADGFAFKMGHHDLSARLVDLMVSRAQASEDSDIVAVAAYVSVETYFVSGDLDTGYRVIVKALDEARDSTAKQRAALGALHMRAAVVGARRGRADLATEHLSAARFAADRTAEGIYGGTAFGPDSFRIHELAVATELHDAAGVERASRWQPPAVLPAERRSHYFIELGRAQFDLGRFMDSGEALRTARRIAPQHTDQHPQVRRIEAALRQARPRRTR